MDEKLIEKMLGQALKQYGRNVATDPLSPGEKNPEAGFAGKADRGAE